jgi:signal transduction histidine kinase
MINTDEITKEPCDARVLMDDAADSMLGTATAKGIRIIKTCEALLPRCAAESRRVVLVLMNLLSNAIRHTPAPGLVSIAVSQGRYQHAGTLLFKVKDTGCGIDRARLESIFGIGSGLAMARAMVELHGGRIWAESWLGGGSTFCFTIPVAAVDVTRPAAAYA